MGVKAAIYRYCEHFVKQGIIIPKKTFLGLYNNYLQYKIKQEPFLFEGVEDEFLYYAYYDAEQVISKIYNYLMVKYGKECEVCCEKGRLDLYHEVYDSPWQEKPHKVYFCSTFCYESFIRGGYSDFDYHECDWCGKCIIQKCPSNGYRNYFRIMNEDEHVCSKCYQEAIFEHGAEIDRDRFNQGKIAGDFFNISELEDHGFVRHVGIHAGYFNCEEISKILLNMLDAGIVFIINYNNMSITGDEGYIDIYVKRGFEDQACEFFPLT